MKASKLSRRELAEPPVSAERAAEFRQRVQALVNRKRMETPQDHGTAAGVVLVFIDEHGNAIADASDFRRAAPGGCTLLEGQRWRARRALDVAVCRAYASPMLTRGMDDGDCARVVEQLVRKHGCRVHEIAIGHKEQS